MKKKLLSIIAVLAVGLCYYFDLPIEEILHSVGQVSEKSYTVAEGIETPKTSEKELILSKMNYTVSFNEKMNIPNWVAWSISKEELIERESRTNKFEPDPALPEHLAVTTEDYTNSGYDRGHMCPAADNKYHWRAMDECFYMTNICPQNHNLNAGVWSSLENQCREWAEEGHTVYIACGPIINAKTKARYIGSEHKVRVPDGFFKVVIYGLESGNPQAAGFVFENKAVGKKSLGNYACTIDEVEKITGFDFFYRLEDEVEERLESKVMTLSN